MAKRDRHRPPTSAATPAVDRAPVTRPRRRWTRVSVIAVVALAFAALAWTVTVRMGWRAGLLGTRASRNVLLVSIDTLRADHVGCYGYRGALTPRLDGLAATGLRFERAATSVPLTLPAHSSLMTGTFPAWHGVRDNGGFYLGEDQVTLAEILRGRGFRTGGFVGSFVLDRRWGIGQGFDRFFDEFDLEKFANAASMDMIERPGSDVVDKALEWLEKDRDRPFFTWVHLYDPHAPYEPKPPFRGRFPRNAKGAYDAEIAYADAQVGRVLDALSADGRLDDTLVVVVGDHGEMLGEHGELTHGFFIYEAATRIPLIITGPRVPRGVIRDQVRIVDVMPTILSLVGVPVPKGVQGANLLPLAEGKRLNLVAHAESWYPRYHYGWSDLRAISDGQFKFIQAPRPEIYDLQADPHEERNRATDSASRVASFSRALEGFEAHITRAGSQQGPQPISPEVEERLAALGYVSGGQSRKRLEEQPRGDPKDKIGIYQKLKQAGSVSVEGRPEEAIAIVQQVLNEDPSTVEAYMLLGNFLERAKRPEEAIAAYRRALALDDEHQNALFSLAAAYKKEGQLDEALAGFERARSLDPRNGKVLWHLADIYMQRQQPAKAEAVMKDALTRGVDQEWLLVKMGESQIAAKRFDDAERSLKAAVARRPDLAMAHFDLGLVYEEKGRLDLAIDAYQSELRHHDTSYRAAFNLAKLLDKQGRSAEALPYFRKVAELQPKFGTGQLYLAKALLDAGDLRSAEQWARTGLGNTPEPELAPLGHYVLADVYERQGRMGEAARAMAAARAAERRGDPPSSHR
jgi:arylsulfatase A-like enzyme/predicted Zn-dependent protease